MHLTLSTLGISLDTPEWGWAEGGGGQKAGREISVAAFTVSTLGETRWLSAAISEWGGGAVVGKF